MLKEDHLIEEGCKWQCMTKDYLKVLNKPQAPCKKSFLNQRKQSFKNVEDHNNDRRPNHYTGGSSSALKRRPVKLSD
jgi:hypothetical protein